jgi:hypothetical protein
MDVAGTNEQGYEDSDLERIIANPRNGGGHCANDEHRRARSDKTRHNNNGDVRVAGISAEIVVNLRQRVESKGRE